MEKVAKLIKKTKQRNNNKENLFLQQSELKLN